MQNRFPKLPLSDLKSFTINQRNDMALRNMTFKMTLNDQMSKVKGHLIKMTLTISKSIVKFKAYTFISFEVTHN